MKSTCPTFMLRCMTTKKIDTLLQELADAIREERQQSDESKEESAMNGLIRKGVRRNVVSNGGSGNISGKDIADALRAAGGGHSRETGA